MKQKVLESNSYSYSFSIFPTWFVKNSGKKVDVCNEEFVNSFIQLHTIYSILLFSSIYLLQENFVISVINVIVFFWFSISNIELISIVLNNLIKYFFKFFFFY